MEPGHLDAQINKGYALQDLDRHGEALDCFDKVIGADSSSMEALNGRGDSLARMGRHEEALGCFERMTEINPHSLAALNNRSTTLYDLGRYGEANKYADKALKVNPDSLTAIRNKSKILTKIGMQLEEPRTSYTVPKDDSSAGTRKDGRPSGGPKPRDGPVPKDRIKKAGYRRVPFDIEKYTSSLKARSETQTSL